MQDLLNQLITTGTGLSLLAGGYLIWLLTGVANNLFNDKKWSWKRMLEDIAKALLWGVAIEAWVALCFGLNWFAGKCGCDIEALMDGASTAGVIGGIIGGTIFYAVKAYKNIINFVNASHVEAVATDINYAEIAEKVKDGIETLLGKSVKEQLEEEGIDTTEIDGEIIEPGKGGIVNTYPEPYRSAAQDTILDPSTCWNREAQPAGTLITMADGSYKEVENLKVGDLLWNHDGTGFVEVKSIWQDEKAVYDISTGLGQIRFTGEHPLYSRQNKWKMLPRGDKKAYGKAGFVKTKDLKVGDKVFVPELEGEKLDLSPNELRWLGFYLGDGTKGQKSDKCPVYRLCVADGRKREFVDSLGVDGSYSKHSSSDKANFFTLSKKSSPKLRLVLDKTQGKSFGLLVVPEQARYIIEGFLEADGCKVKGDVYSASSTDKKLLLAIQRMVLSIGGTMSIHKRYDAQELEKFGTRVYAKTLWDANINLNPRKKMVHEFDDGKYATITRISRGDELEKVYNIEVSGSHTYIADNHGVHNCVSYTAWKIAELKGSWMSRTGSMNAKEWVYRLPEHGYKEVAAPRNGGFYIGVSQLGTYGHVVKWEGGNTISEYNYATRGGFSVRNINLATMRWFEIEAPESPKPTPAPEPSKVSFKVGDIVKPTKLVDYNGTKLKQYDETYVIMQLVGNRAVLGAIRGQKQVVWAAMNTANIELA